MSIDLSSEHLITLAEAVKVLPGRPHISTIWRWWARGVRGIRLETAVIGGRRFTSTQALQRFAEASTAVANGDVTGTPSNSTSTARQRRIADAERELDEAGI